MMSPDLTQRVERILEHMRGLDDLVVAFSGGVDSSVVAQLAYDALGDRALAVTAVSETLAQRELDEAKAIAAEIGIRHELIAFSELDDARFVQNTPSRCFFCQTMRFGQLRAIAEKKGFGVVASGSNASDLGDHRPGLKAMENQRVYQPLLDEGIDKQGVRAIAKRYDLSVWDKPAKACLSSRIPHGLEVTQDRLRRIERAEEILHADYGVRQLRVRDHGGIARIEIASDELHKIYDAETLRDLYNKIVSAGFDVVTLDMVGYRAGSLNPASKGD